MPDRVIAEAVLRNIYSGPMEVEVNERLVGAVQGELRLTRLEWETMVTDEKEFVAILTAYLKELASAMGESVLDYIPTWDWPKR